MEDQKEGSIHGQFNLVTTTSNTQVTFFGPSDFIGIVEPSTDMSDAGGLLVLFDENANEV